MKAKSKIRDLMVHIAWGKHALVFILRCHLGHVLLLLKKVMKISIKISIAISQQIERNPNIAHDSTSYYLTAGSFASSLKIEEISSVLFNTSDLGFLNDRSHAALSTLGKNRES